MDIPQAFADLNSKFVETVNSHDAHRWAALFSEDAVLVPAGQPSVNGRNRIEEWGEVATAYSSAKKRANIGREHHQAERSASVLLGTVPIERNVCRTSAPWGEADLCSR